MWLFPTLDFIYNFDYSFACSSLSEMVNFLVCPHLVPCVPSLIQKPSCSGRFDSASPPTHLSTSCWLARCVTIFRKGARASQRKLHRLQDFSFSNPWYHVTQYRQHDHQTNPIYCGLRNGHCVIIVSLSCHLLWSNDTLVGLYATAYVRLRLSLR